MRKMIAGYLIACTTLVPGAAAAADAYVLGLTGDMTGRDSANSGAAADGIRIYFERLNAKGGINGRKVEVLMRDNQPVRIRDFARVERGPEAVFNVVNAQGQRAVLQLF